MLGPFLCILYAMLPQVIYFFEVNHPLFLTSKFYLQLISVNSVEKMKRGFGMRVPRIIP